MEAGTIVQCFQCHHPIVSSEGFVCFKVPGQQTYQFFHYRIRADDCWEGHLKERKRDFGEPRACLDKE